MASGIRQQGQVASSFDGDRQLSLMLGTRTYFSPRTNVAPLGQETLQNVHSLVVDDVCRIFTKRTYFEAARKALPPPGRASSLLSRALSAVIGFCHIILIIQVSINQGVPP
jgi:hypothetical protein